MENNVITEVTNLFPLFPKLRRFTNLSNKGSYLVEIIIFILVKIIITLFT